MESISQQLKASTPFRKMLTGVGVFVAVCVIAVSGYMAAGWRFADSIYMVIITIFGVGYGEVQPVQSNGLRALTILVIISGYAAVIYTVGGFMQLVIDGELNRALGARRMTRGIERLSNHTIVCGVGRLGTILAQELRASSRPFVVIDIDLARLQGLEEQGFLIIHGDASDEDVLEQAGVRRAATLATVLSSDATNIFVTITARELNPALTIIARGENPRTEKKLLGCGATRVVLPTAIGAQKVAQLIVRPTAEELFDQLARRSDLLGELNQLGLEVSELAIEPNSSLQGKSIISLETSFQVGLLVLGIRSQSGVTTMHPEPETTLKTGDTLIFLAHDRQAATVLNSQNTAGSEMIYRGVKLNG